MTKAKKRRAVPADPNQIWHPPKVLAEAHDDSWEVYHVAVAIILVLGVITATHSLSELMHRLHGMSELEQSGLGAAGVVAMRGVGKFFGRAAAFVATVLSWARRHH